MNNDQNNLHVEIKYAGFWKRLAAHLIDFLILSPTMLIMIYFYNYKLAHYVITTINFTLLLFYEVYLVQKYGGTPGKKIMKIEIRKLDLSRVSYREAFLRYSVALFLVILQNIIGFIGLAAMPENEMLTLSYLDLYKKLTEISPPFVNQIANAISIWVWIEFLVILFNKKKRSPNDYIAGTVVIEIPKKAT